MSKTGSAQQQPDAAGAAARELRAQEQLARVLCTHIQHLVTAAHSRGVLQSREDRLQTEVFAERCEQVMRLLDTPTSGIDEPRMARLEKLIEALEFSRSYFRRI